MAIDLCGLPGNPPSQEAGKRRGKARHRQLSYCGAALPVGVVSISPTTWASLAFPEEHGGFRRAHTVLDPRAGSGTTMSRTSFPSRCRIKN